MNFPLSSFGETLWHSSMYQSGCLILYSRPCVTLHMQHHPQQMIMMLLINLDDNIKWRYGSFSDLFVWRIGLRKVRIFWSIIHYSTICPCLLDKCDRILYTIENDITSYIIFNGAICLHLRTRWDRILYNYIHVITPYYSTWICLSIVQQSVQSIPFLISLPYAMKSYDAFPKFTVCAQFVSTC